jgi:hypothetical protein
MAFVRVRRSRHLLAESSLTALSFGAMLGRGATLPVPTGQNGPRRSRNRVLACEARTAVQGMQEIQGFRLGFGATVPRWLGTTADL